jgi:hypothetical protein
MSHRNRALATCALLIATAAARPGRARADDAALPWLRLIRSNGSEACAGAPELGERIQRRLGRSAEDTARLLRVTIVARIRRRLEGPGGWSGEIDVVRADGTTAGQRALDRADESCEPMIDALAFVTAMVLDSGTSSSIFEPLPTPVPAARAVAVTASAQPRTTPLTTQPRWTFAVEGGAALGVGLLPGPAPAGEASIFVAPPGAPALYASASIWPEARASVTPDRGATLALALAGAGVCPAAVKAARAVFAACLGAEVGRLRAGGFGLDNPVTQDRWAADVTVGAHLRWPIVGGFYVASGVRLVVPLVRDQIAYRDPSGEVRDIFRMPPLAFVGQLRLGYSRQ